MSRFVVAVRAALPSPRPQGWQALQMAVGLADRGVQTTLIADAARPDGGPSSLASWIGRDLPSALQAVIPRKVSSPPWAGVRFRRALSMAAGRDATLICRDPRVAASQRSTRWRSVVMEWHVQPDPTDPRHRGALRNADLHVTVAPGLLDDLDFAGVPARRKLLLPNACGLGRERARGRAPVAGGPVVAMGLHRRDGLDHALRAWQLAPALPPLLIVGRDQGGVRWDRWRDKILAAGLEGRVSLCGPVWGDAREDLLDTASAWLAAYPEDEETRARLCPLQVMDALGSGLPLIAPRLHSVLAASGGAPFHDYKPEAPGSLAAAVQEAIAAPRLGRGEDRPRWGDRAADLIEALSQREAA